MYKMSKTSYCNQIGWKMMMLKWTLKKDQDHGHYLLSVAEQRNKGHLKLLLER